MDFFTSALEGKNTWQLYLVGFLITMAGYFIGQLPLTLVLVYQVASRTDIGPSDITAFQDNMDFSKFGIDPNVGFFFMILIFVFAMAGLYLAVKIHGRRFLTLISPNATIDWSRVLYGFGLWAVLITVSEAITYFMAPEDYTFRFSIQTFIPLLLLAVFLLPIQTSFEEMFFRGYLLQGIGLALKNKVAAILITSVLFAMMHSMNPEVTKFGLGTMMFYYLSAGAFLAIITVMDNRLELALGVHAATNVLGATLVTYSGSVLQTDTLFLVTEIKPWVMILFFYASAIIFYVVCAKKYGWKNLYTILEPIPYETNQQNPTNA
ncbi:MAG: type II CAAX endopeptidase family protein [Saprospiraceae bacterium]